MSFFVGLFVGAVVVLLMLSGSGSNRDSTDSPDKRSGMRLHTDHLTGLQYLSAPGGGLTPRLDANGRHMRVEDGQ